MSKLGIKKDTDESIEKLADALPHETWGTFLMMLRSNRKDYKKMTLGDFIKHLEAQEMEQRKIAKKQEDLKKNVVQKKIESRTCFQCKTAGHIARNCRKSFRPKQEVSQKLKEKLVEKTELTTKNFTGFENSTFEIGECSKNVIKRKENVTNQKWVVKGSGNSSGNESVSTKTEEPQVIRVYAELLGFLN